MRDFPGNSIIRHFFSPCPSLHSYIMNPDKRSFTNLIKTGACHLCQQPTIVFSCYQDYQPTSCAKTFCAGCCERYTGVRFPIGFETLSTWQCPSKRRQCPCEACRVCDMRPDLRAVVLSLQDDPVKAVLEYNALLICHLNEKRMFISQQEMDTSMQLLFENLRSLAVLSAQQSSS